MNFEAKMSQLAKETHLFPVFDHDGNKVGEMPWVLGAAEAHPFLPLLITWRSRLFVREMKVLGFSYHEAKTQPVNIRVLQEREPGAETGGKCSGRYLTEHASCHVIWRSAASSDWIRGCHCECAACLAAWKNQGSPDVNERTFYVE